MLINPVGKSDVDDLLKLQIAYFPLVRHSGK